MKNHKQNNMFFGEKGEDMLVKREFIGETKQETPIYGYNIKNSNGMEICVMNFGANIRNIFVPDKDGNKVDVVLGYEDYQRYFENPESFGALVGPVANRTAGAAFTIDGNEYHIEVNEGVNNLHSHSQNGFQKCMWDTQENEDGVTFTITAKDGELGFPGNRTMTVTYSLSENNELMIHYHATSDKKTIFNPTNHTYFNLSGHKSGTVLNHELKLNASNYTPAREDSIPTGEIASVKGTPFDFLETKTIGKDIHSDNEQLHITGGYDHNFCIDDADGSLRQFAILSSNDTGIKMHCSTTLPGFQLYSANFLKGVDGKDGAFYNIQDGICLETQCYPNSINTPGFPNTVFGPENDYDSVTVFQIETE